mgnify:CR=1 FL=1
MAEPSEKESKSDRWADLPEYDIEKLDYDYVGKCENLQGGALSFQGIFGSGWGGQ